MGWPGLTGPPGTQKGPRARAWAGGQARRPVRHGPQGTTGPPRPVRQRAGPARCRAGPGRAGPLPRYKGEVGAAVASNSGPDMVGLIIKAQR